MSSLLSYSQQKNAQTQGQVKQGKEHMNTYDQKGTSIERDADSAQFSAPLDICKSHMHELRQWQSWNYMMYPENCMQIVACFGDAIGQAVEYMQCHGGGDEHVIRYLLELKEISCWEEE